MKLKTLFFVAAVASCQPIAVYPQSEGMTVIDTYSFGIGVTPKSSITLFSDGPCEQIVFDNTLIGSTDVVTANLGGHYIMLMMGDDTIPDEMSVTPASGYYVDGEDRIMVEDGSIGTIIVCMQAMS